jgi:DNA modification methylase
MKKKPPFDTQIPSAGPAPSDMALKLLYRPLTTLRASKRNARRHNERQLVKLGASIKRYGFLVPVLITADGEIVAGEARAEAARRAGLSEVPTICIDHLTENQVREFRIADNRLGDLSTFDQEALAIEIGEILSIDMSGIEVMGFDTAEIDVILEGAGGADESEADPADNIPEPPAFPISWLGDLWCLGKHRLLCGSSLEELSWERLMDGRTAAMGFTDAPYNVKIDKNVCGLGKVKHDEFAMASGEMSEGEFTAFLATALERMSAHLGKGAILAACMDWRHLFELLTAARKTGLDLLNMCVWNKANGGMGSLYRSKHELVLILKKPGASHINNVELGRHGRYRTNVWDYAGINSFGAKRDEELKAHPTVKPVRLCADAIRDVSRHGDIVIDAFMGSGTTIVAAERTGRIGYGIEIEPKYIDVAIRRWEAMTGKAAILEATGETFAEVTAARTATVHEAA